MGHNTGSALLEFNVSTPLHGKSHVSSAIKHNFSKLDTWGELPHGEHTGVCYEIVSYFEEKIPNRVCQFYTKIPERAIISVRNFR